jgi:hypothetical protein
MSRYKKAGVDMKRKEQEWEKEERLDKERFGHLYDTLKKSLV